EDTSQTSQLGIQNSEGDPLTENIRLRIQKSPPKPRRTKIERISSGCGRRELFVPLCQYLALRPSWSFLCFSLFLNSSPGDVPSRDCLLGKRGQEAIRVHRHQPKSPVRFDVRVSQNVGHS